MSYGKEVRRPQGRLGHAGEIRLQNWLVVRLFQVFYVGVKMTLAVFYHMNTAQLMLTNMIEN